MGGTTIVRSEPGLGRADEIQPHPEAVREQLTRMLGSPLFRNSRHYPNLLRYVVEETLEGRAGHLKERELGVKVFGRDPAYDSNADPVVRTSACEVRKRIAQYYHEPGHETEVRIDVPAGCYVPDFRLPAARPPAAAPTPVEPEPVTVAARVAPRKWFHMAGVLAMVAILGIATFELRGARGAVEQFWAPVWGSSDSVMLCLGGSFRLTPQQIQPVGSQSGPDNGPTFQDVMRSDHVAFSDALTMARLTGLMREHGKKSDIRRGTLLTLTDLRKVPVILIGAFNNAWTMRLENQLRYVFEFDEGKRIGVIRDRDNPTKADWRYTPDIKYSQITEDYAIVSRFVDPRTERMVVVVAGMGRDGTLAAGEFVTEPRYLEKFAGKAPKGWERKNLQVVLATEVMNGNIGPPRILATHFW
jgi:hypothetical protein